MRRAYQASLNVRFAVDAANDEAADTLAEAFVTNLAAWMDGSLGSPPFAPWMTAWYDESLVPLALRHDQLLNWSAITDPDAPFATEQ